MTMKMAIVAVAKSTWGIAYRTATATTACSSCKCYSTRRGISSIVKVMTLFGLVGNSCTA